jgi:hypothetical protein
VWQTVTFLLTLSCSPHRRSAFEPFSTSTLLRDEWKSPFYHARCPCLIRRFGEADPRPGGFGFEMEDEKHKSEKAIFRDLHWSERKWGNLEETNG